MNACPMFAVSDGTRVSAFLIEQGQQKSMIYRDNSRNESSIHVGEVCKYLVFSSTIRRGSLC